jgi:hypothetical protein
MVCANQGAQAGQRAFRQQPERKKELTHGLMALAVRSKTTHNAYPRALADHQISISKFPFCILSAVQFDSIIFVGCVVRNA